MPNKTNIEWCDYSSQLIRYRDSTGKDVWACVKCSPGCAHCYSESIAERFRRGGPFNRAATDGVTPYFADAEHRAIVRMKALAGKRVFIGDMTDVFGEWVPDDRGTVYSESRAKVAGRVSQEIPHVRHDDRAKWREATPDPPGRVPTPTTRSPPRPHRETSRGPEWRHCRHEGRPGPIQFHRARAGDRGRAEPGDQGGREGADGIPTVNWRILQLNPNRDPGDPFR